MYYKSAKNGSVRRFLMTACATPFKCRLSGMATSNCRNNDCVGNRCPHLTCFDFILIKAEANGSFGRRSSGLHLYTFTTPARCHQSTHSCHQWVSDGTLIGRNLAQMSRFRGAAPTANQLFVFLDNSFGLKNNWHSKGGHGLLSTLAPLSTLLFRAFCICHVCITVEWLCSWTSL